MEIVAEHAEQIRRELRDVEEQAYESQKASVADAKARMEAACAWINRTGLKTAIPHIVEEMRPWHAWVKRDDFRRWVPFDVYDIEAEWREEPVAGYTSPRKTWRVDFSLDPAGARYGIEFSESPGSFEGTHFGEAAVYEAATEVFRIECQKSYSDRDEDPRWVTWQPSVLVPGDWVATVLTLDHRLRLHRNSSMMQRQGESLRERAAGLPEPGALA